MDNKKNNSYNDIFDEHGFDEMQLAKKHEIGFKLFRALFWVIYAASIAMMFIAAGLENQTFMLIGTGFVSICTTFYLVYEAKLAAAGLMNPKYAQPISTGVAMVATLALCIIFILAWVSLFLRGKTDLFTAVMWANLGAMYIGNCLCARKNMKVLEKMLKEDNDEEN